MLEQKQELKTENRMKIVKQQLITWLKTKIDVKKNKQ